MKRLLPILIVLGVLFVGLGQVAYAAQDHISLYSRTYIEGIEPRWVYQFEYTTYATVNMDETLDDTRYVRVPSGYYDANGYPILAQGTLSLVGTAYDFPKVGKKQGTYEGIVTAYINDSLLY